jgi:glycosyltransferase involved in cell wall biosynthesis
MTRISVAMTTCQGENYVAEQLQSIVTQSRLPDELIVCDDGSTDQTLAIVKAALADVPFRVEVVSNPRRLGVVANVEQAIRRTTGDIVVLADHDDLWRPQKLVRLEARFEADAEVGAVFSNARIIDQHSHRTGEWLWPRVGFTGARQSRWRTDPLGVLMQGNVVTGAALAFRASLKRLILPIPRVGWHDLWIACLVGATSRIDALDEVLLDYRVHGRNAAGLPRSMREELVRRLHQPEERYDNLAQIVALKTRLEEYGFGASPEVAQLRIKIRHLQFRFDLPSSFPARAIAVLQAATAGRYERYSAGNSSALFDLVYGGRLARPQS